MIHKEYNRELSQNLSARLGLWVAGTWIISFLIVVLHFPSFISEFGYLFGLLSIVLVGRNLKHMRALVMPISWTQGLMLCLLAFMGGALITTLFQFVYFAYFDHGHFIGAILKNLEDPEFIKMMKEAGNGEMLDQLTDIIKSMSELGARELTLNLFSTNVTYSIIFSLIATLLGGKPSKIEK